MKIGIIGLGNIGTALLNGLESTYSVIFLDKKNSQGDIEIILDSSDIVLLCIRTNQVINFLAEHRALFIGKTVILFQAGISLSDFDTKISKEIVLFRAITNINVASKNGYTVLLKNEFAKEYITVFDLLKSVGVVREVQTENELESIALLPGCSPAIVALLVHYLEGILVRHGIDKNSNKEAIFAAVSGTIATMRQSKSTSLDIAKSVASPGGKVEKALAEVIDSHSLEQVLTKYFDEITKH